MTLEQFHRDQNALIAAAKKPGGVTIVAPDGSVRCHVTIPHTRLRWLLRG
jgi:hypothetical protein